MYSSRRNADGIPKKRLKIGELEGPREIRERTTADPRRDDLKSAFMVRVNEPSLPNLTSRQSRQCREC